MSLARAAALPSLVAGVYVCLVLALWAPFGPQNGMPYETALVYVPETTSFFNGYEYLDELRRWTQLFYTVGYRLSDVLGIDGSFLGLQLVYAVLWWARGLLAFLIVRRLLPSPLVAFAAGALVLVHASDHALNWVGQLNQFGVIFWLLLSIYLLVVGLQQKQPLPGVTVWRLAAATETDLAFVEAVFLVPLVILFSMIPITIAGWGVREGAMVVALGTVGVDRESALAVSVLFGLAIAIASLPGGVVWLATRSGIPADVEAKVPVRSVWKPGRS